VRFEAEIDVAAPAERVFGVYADVSRWPEWTASVSSVRRLDDGPLRIGSRTRIKQPKLPVAVWEVTVLEPDRSFTWIARGPGLLTTASHEVTPSDDGRSSHVVATLLQDGIFGPLVGGLSKGLTERYLELELHGLKTRCEHGFAGG
jgi:uncharacterized protein YndB with AHSA1/START domain